jgi:Xaa-Pro aminopeptidase
VIGDGLVEIGVIRGDPQALLESGTITLFFPHGVGHMVGLGIRDAGVYEPRRAPEAGLPAIRVDLPLESGYAMTVEPGVYFVEPLLRDAARDDRFRALVDWERVEGLLGFGGIRVEENVLITDGGCEVLTAEIPTP